MIRIHVFYKRKHRRIPVGEPILPSVTGWEDCPDPTPEPGHELYLLEQVQRYEPPPNGPRKFTAFVGDFEYGVEVIGR